MMPGVHTRTEMEGHTFPGKIRSGFMQGAILVIVGTAVALGANMIRAEGLVLPGDWNSSVVTHSHRFSLITPEEAFTLYNENKILFVDAREPSAYEQGHLPGALNVPHYDAEKYLEQLKSVVKAGKELVTYCSGPDCPMSFDLAEILKTHGIGPVKVMEQGWIAWYESGFPIEEGTAE